jgi:hypothetical protein
MLSVWLSGHIALIDSLFLPSSIQFESAPFTCSRAAMVVCGYCRCGCGVRTRKVNAAGESDAHVASPKQTWNRSGACAVRQAVAGRKTARVALNSVRQGGLVANLRAENLCLRAETKKLRAELADLRTVNRVLRIRLLVLCFAMLCAAHPLGPRGRAPRVGGQCAAFWWAMPACGRSRQSLVEDTADWLRAALKAGGPFHIDLLLQCRRAVDPVGC